MERQLWQILVPYQTNDGKKVDLEHHRQWDARVRAIAGGLTILSPMQGQWLFDEKLYEEKIVPVLVVATRSEVEKIVDMTLEHYADQECILAFRLSNEVLTKYRE